MRPDGDLEVVPDGVLRVEDAESEVARSFLPVTTVQVHASSLLALPDRDVLCFWFGGTQEGMSDIDIWGSRLEAGSDRWSPAVRLSDDADRSEQNPVGFLTPDGGILLLWTAQVAGHQDTAEVRCRRSDDGGRSWGPATVLFTPDASGGVFVRQPPVILDPATWVLPVFRCPVEPGRPWSGDLDSSAVRITRDAGETWEEIPVPHSVGAVHMSIVARPSGDWRAYYRSRRADHVLTSVSSDAISWSAPVATSLPNNNSSIQAIALANGAVGLVYNHSSAADATDRRISLYDEIESSASDEPVEGVFWGAPRAPLSLAIAHDAETWERPVEVAIGDGFCLTNDSRGRSNRELSYPSIAQLSDGTLHVTFTYHRRGIRHLRFPPTVVTAQAQ